jgi:hypothetical protein
MIFYDLSCNRDGMYVRVNGHLKSFKGVKQLVAFSVRYCYKKNFVSDQLGHVWKDVYSQMFAVYLVLVLSGNVLHNLRPLDLVTSYTSLSRLIHLIKSYICIIYRLYISLYVLTKKKACLKGNKEKNCLYSIYITNLCRNCCYRLEKRNIQSFLLVSVGSGVSREASIKTTSLGIWDVAL